CSASLTARTGKTCAEKSVGIFPGCWGGNCFVGSFFIFRFAIDLEVGFLLRPVLVVLLILGASHE
ncbi:hypothetical protein, partial [Pseudomonas amygdali]